MTAIHNMVKALILRGEEILVVETRSEQGSRFALPGGLQHPGSSLADALRTACSEQIGAAVEVGELAQVRDYMAWSHEPGEVDEDVRVVEFYFRCSVSADFDASSESPGADGSVATRWIALSELPDVQHIPEGLLELLRSPGGQKLYLGGVS
ncbi:MAG: NUDIX domain-containing protein [Myxococcales bacterium]|nr:NUDIX domain-containing protein [Myxococcales bacterium]